MIVSDGMLKRLVKENKLIINPYQEENVQPASVDLRLGRGFLIPDYNKIESLSLDTEVPYRKIDEDSIIIPPHHFILATTLECIGLSNCLAGRVEGRSSIGRRGLFVQNAGWVDPGFNGNITLELYNANESPIKIYSGRRICQLVLQFTDRPVEKPYSGKYIGQKGTMGSLAHKDSELK